MRSFIISFLVTSNILFATITMVSAEEAVPAAMDTLQKAAAAGATAGAGALAAGADTKTAATTGAAAAVNAAIAPQAEAPAQPALPSVSDAIEATQGQGATIIQHGSGQVEAAQKAAADAATRAQEQIAPRGTATDAIETTTGVLGAFGIGTKKTDQ